jgi:DNA polymerase elongation subunit (family B)
MIYYLDTEVYRNYFLLCLLPEKGEALYFEIHNNRITHNDLNGFDWQGVFVTFNGIGYDLPVLAALKAGFNNEQLKQLSDDIIIRNIPWWEIYDHYNLTQAQMTHIDISNVLPGKVSLKLYGGRIHTPKLQDLPIEPDARIEDSQTGLMRLYCTNDCRVTRELFFKIKDQIQLRERMGLEYGMDLRSKSDAQIAETVIASMYREATGSALSRPTDVATTHRYIAPDYVKFRNTMLSNLVASIEAMTFTLKESGHVDAPTGLKQRITLDGMRYDIGLGGLHSVDAPGSFYDTGDYQLFDIDVASYYPSLALNIGYEPSHMVGEFSQIYRSLVEKRLQAKRTKDTVTADTLKITINGTFGKLGSKYSKMYAPDLMMGVTLTGQLSLLMLIERLPGLVISANTDGIMVRIAAKDVAKAQEIVSQWEKDTNLVMEWTRYSSVHRRDVNNYIAITTDKKIKTKGVFANTGLNKNPSFPIIQKAVIAYFDRMTPPEQTIRDCTDVTDFLCVRTVKGGAQYRGAVLGKVVRWYRSWLSAETINYATNGNKVPLSDGSVPLMDLPDTLPADIDYQWYIDEASKLIEVMQ